MLGMMNHLSVGNAKGVSAERGAAEGTEYGEQDPGESHAEMHEGHEMEADSSGAAKTMRVMGGGPVIQILPGPFPFADSAMVVVQKRPPDQQVDLTKKAHMGPYSNNVAKIDGSISLVAIDRGASGDSVSGVAEFTVQDGARWKVIIDRVQTQGHSLQPRALAG
jgi:hypothetical protein